MQRTIHQEIKISFFYNKTNFCELNKTLKRLLLIEAQPCRIY